jgi:hypothetical protein
LTTPNTIEFQDEDRERQRTFSISLPGWLGATSDVRTEPEVVINLNSPDDDIDFITLHNILYYLHVGCVNLPFPGSRQNLGDNETYKHPEGFPNEVDAFALYKASNKFIISDLTDHCFQFLKLTLTPTNVSERLFHGDSDLRLYDDLVEVYFKFLLDNYDKVKDTDGWNEALRREYGDDDASEFAWSMLCRVTKSLVVAPKKGKNRNA